MTSDFALRIGIPKLVFDGFSIFVASLVESIRALRSISEPCTIPVLPHPITMTRCQLPDYAKSCDGFTQLMEEFREAELKRFRRSQEVGRYLGANIFHGRQRRSNFNHIVERIQQRLAGWKANCLSMAGRATLVQSVLSTIPLYHMQHCKIPKGTIEEIKKLEREFLWGSTAEKRSMHQVNWKTVCLPKNLGGLGIRSLNNMNKAFLFKLAWNLLTNQKQLWVEVVVNKYNFNISQRHEIGWKATDSRLWKDIMKIWLEFMQHVSWTIGDGRTILFWEDKWLEGRKNLRSLCRVEQDQILQSELVDETGVWRNINTSEHIPEDVKVRILNCCPPNPDLGKDIPCWEPDTNGDFTIKSAYCSINNLQTSRFPVWDSIWKANTIQRHKLLMWKLAHDRLPTRSRLASWSNKSPLCPRCGSFRETNSHSSRDCRKVSSIWNYFIKPTDRSTFYFLPIKDWLVNKLCQDENFSTPTEPHKIILGQAKIFMQAWANKDNSTPNVRIISVSGWRKPNQEWIKVNTDGAVCRTTKIAGCKGVCRDENGRWKLGFIANIGIATVNGAELWGIYNGLKTAWDCGWKKIIIECDSKRAVEDAKSRNTSNGIEHPILCKIRDLLAKDWEVQIKLIERSANSLISSEAGGVVGIPDSGD
ncbi:ribonuclease H [Senna tora]|uniref:Ribonuclease H n=1 Tax=Senna tora TaxID=362788 RepID=A0A834X0W4_9FABA|nr:ribonuclease H [Senna tora]